jgi:hypothetical protein
MGYEKTIPSVGVDRGTYLRGEKRVSSECSKSRGGKG